MFLFHQIRRQMIDGQSGQMQIRTLLKSIDEVCGFSLQAQFIHLRPLLIVFTLLFTF